MNFWLLSGVCFEMETGKIWKNIAEIIYFPQSHKFKELSLNTFEW